MTAPEILEARIAPAAFVWNVDSDGDWNRPENWYNETTGRVSDGFPSAPEDSALFGSAITMDRVVTIPDGLAINVGTIKFADDNGYKIVTAGTGSLSISAQNIFVLPENTGDQEIAAKLSVSARQFILQNDSPGTLKFSGRIWGEGGILKTGPGTVELGGTVANSYVGQTVVQEGVLQLSKTVGGAVSARLSIGEGPFTAAVRYSEKGQIRTDDSFVRIGINGSLDTDGHNQSLETLFVASGEDRASYIRTGDGTLRISSLVHGQQGSGDVGVVIDGNVGIGGSYEHQFVISDGAAEVDLAITGQLIGWDSATLGKEGEGALSVGSTNLLTDGVAIYSGSLIVTGKSGFTRLVGHSLNTTFSPTWLSNGFEMVGGTTELGRQQPLLEVVGNLKLSGGTLAIDLGADAASDERINLTGTAQLGGTLALTSNTARAGGEIITLIANDGTDRVTGTFAGLPEGLLFAVGENLFRISYVGGDGNDVTLKVAEAEVAISPNGRTATYFDLDGDIVKIRTSKGRFDAGDFTFTLTANDYNGQQLSLLNLADDGGEFRGADISITAKPSEFGGDGRAHMNFLDSTGVDLGKVTVDGDLAQIEVGDGNGLAMKALKLRNLNERELLGPEDAGRQSVINGGLRVFATEYSVIGQTLRLTGDDGHLGKATIGGSMIGTGEEFSGSIVAEGSIGEVIVRGDFKGGAGRYSGGISALDSIQKVRVDGSLLGGTGFGSGSVISYTGSIKSISVGESLVTSTFSDGAVNGGSGASIRAAGGLGSVKIGGDIVGEITPVVISAGGNNAPGASGPDLAIGKISVHGSVTGAAIYAGFSPLLVGVNADASVGEITVGGDWIESRVHVGADESGKLAGDNVRDEADVFARIAKVVIGGNVEVRSGETYLIIAEQIDSAQVGDTSFAFDPGPNDPADSVVISEGGVGEVVIREVLTAST